MIAVGGTFPGECQGCYVDFEGDRSCTNPFSNTEYEQRLQAECGEGDADPDRCPCTNQGVILFAMACDTCD